MAVGPEEGRGSAVPDLAGSGHSGSLAGAAKPGRYVPRSPTQGQAGWSEASDDAARDRGPVGRPCRCAGQNESLSWWPLAAPSTLGAVRLGAGKPVRALVVVFAGLTASACGASHTTTTTRTVSAPVRPTTPTTKATTTSTPAHTAPPVPSLPHIGASQRVPAPGTTMVVTIRSLIDPLRDSGAHLTPGMKPVAILVAVRNAGPGGYDSSSTGDFSLDSAAGQANPVFRAQGRVSNPSAGLHERDRPGRGADGMRGLLDPERPATYDRRICS